MKSRDIKIPPRYNYIACFLTLACNLKCDYCVNCYGNNHLLKNEIISGKKLVRGLNRLICSSDLPITLQGGEPSLHPDFLWIINNIKTDIKIDILTNLNFDIDAFIDNVNPESMRRNAPYPTIRVSYHPYHMELAPLIKKVLRMQQAGFSIGIFSIFHPKFEEEVLRAKEQCVKLGIDFRTKDFLGKFNGRIYGNYRYPDAVDNASRKKCLCRVSELIIGPTGDIYKCHHDLYNNFPPIGNLLGNNFKIRDIYRECSEFGNCNPCDIKIKTNRFQIQGHTSAEINNIRDV